MTRKPLSVHRQHELLLKLEEAGLNDKAAQKIIESGGNKLARQMLALIPHDSIAMPNLNEAMSIVGQKNFFGPKEWHDRINKKFGVSQVPAIPWTRDEITKEPSFLWFGMEYLERRWVNLNLLYWLFRANNHPSFSSNWFLTHRFADEKLAFRWHLMPLGVAHGLTEDYTLASAVERITANALYYLLNGKYLDQQAWALTSSNTDGGSSIRVRGRSNTGLEILMPSDVNREAFSIAALRKINK